MWKLKPNQGKGQHFIILTSPLHHAPALIGIISIIRKQYSQCKHGTEKAKEKNNWEVSFVHCHICSNRIKAM